MFPSVTSINSTSNWVNKAFVVSKGTPNWSTTWKVLDNILAPEAAASVHPDVLKLLISAPPKLSDNIKEFKSDIKPAVVVSKYISKLETVGVVS